MERRGGGTNFSITSESKLGGNGIRTDTNYRNNLGFAAGLILMRKDCWRTGHHDL